MDFKKTFRGILALLVISLIPVVGHCAGQLRQSDAVMGTRLVATSSTTATLVFSSATAPSLDPLQNEICWRNMGTDSSQFIYISTFSTVDETTYGWPIAGTEKECHDFGPNIRLYIWHTDAEATKNVIFMYSR